MPETITRQAWLRLELEIAEDFVARFADSDDPIDRAQVSRRGREASAFRDELGQIEGAPVVTIRLSGTGIEGNNAPVDVVEEIVQRYGQIADEYGADVLVAPSAPGSHVIRIVAPSQAQLPTFDTFGEAADAVIGLSPDTLKPGESLEEHALIHAADLTTGTLRAVRKIMATLARLRIDAEVELDAPERSARVRVRRDTANDLDRILGDLDQEAVERKVEGVMRGFTALGGHFQIEADRIYKGRVPKAVRAAANGIPLGSTVRAVIEEITTTFRSGDHRVRFRLKDIRSAEER